ncbi:hypothetical protein FGG08_003763 [Glutinoglossum americanum]|uniref:Transposase n=1 Tax=Glutinoglossum americanum TaxID=1670608 RepID=A0A9P8L4I0_9PEZI|nr:hypothetical protein FGG08_003763 [Glutinoglossum americanum]
MPIQKLDNQERCPHNCQLASPLVASLANYEFEFSASCCLDGQLMLSQLTAGYAFQRYTTKQITSFDMAVSKAPSFRKLGRPRKLTTADEEAVLELLLVEGWRRQDEIVFWLWCERGVLANRSIISRMLKRRKWTQKELRRISLGLSEDLRRGWREEMRQYVAEDLVFFDESIFDEKTGWRYRAYGPIGQDTRYPANTQRGRT